MAKNLEISFLLDFYGDMLTDKQRDVVELYYNEDLSLAEIAEQLGVSRTDPTTGRDIQKTEKPGQAERGRCKGGHA